MKIAWPLTIIVEQIPLTHNFLEGINNIFRATLFLLEKTFSDDVLRPRTHTMTCYEPCLIDVAPRFTYVPDAGASSLPTSGHEPPFR